MENFNEFTPFAKNYSINVNGFLMDFSTPKIMGILNLTPDSFFEDSRVTNEKKILTKVEKMLSEGADIIDIGAFSSSPSSTLISEEEERERLLNPLKSIVKEFPKAIISVDTYRSNIAKEVVLQGASIINDISGGGLDTNMFKTIKELNVPYVLMHMQGTPDTMQVSPRYDDVFNDIYSSLSERLAKLSSIGVNDVILDVGFGFGKTLDHNYTLLKKLQHFHTLNCPLLVGVSRKKMIQKLIQQDAIAALNGTSVVHAIALLNGANILRVHDVNPAKEAIQIVDFYQKQ